MGIDILGIDILGVDILGIDIPAPTRFADQRLYFVTQIEKKNLSYKLYVYYEPSHLDLQCLLIYLLLCLALT